MLIWVLVRRKNGEEIKIECEGEEEEKREKKSVHKENKKEKKIENQEKSAPILNVTYPHAPLRKDNE